MLLLMTGVVWVTTRSGWLWELLTFLLFFAIESLIWSENPICNYFQVIRLLINFTSNHLLTASSDKSIRFFAIFVFPPFWFFNDIFHQILCSLHTSAPSGNWMSNLRNETKILHLPKAQRNQALAAFVNLNHLNKNYFFSGLKYLSSKSQSVFQPQDINQSSVFKTFLALGSDTMCLFNKSGMTFSLTSIWLRE